VRGRLRFASPAQLRAFLAELLLAVPAATGSEA